MFFVEDYGATAKELKKESQKLEKGVKDIFYLIGVTMATYPEQSRNVLESHGYSVKKNEDMVNAVSDMFVQGGDKWDAFMKQFSPMMQGTVDKAQKAEAETGQESGWVQAVIAAVGQIGGGITNAVGSKHQREAAKETSKAEMYKGLTGIIQEKEKRKTAKENQKIWIAVIIGVVFIAVIITMFIVMRKKAKPAVA